MKKLFSIFLAFTLLLTLVACGKSNSASNSDLSTEKKESSSSASDSDIAKPIELPASDSNVTEADLGRTVTLYIPNGNSDGLDEVNAVIEYDEKSLFQALLNSGEFPEGWKLVQFSIESDGETVDNTASASDIYGTKLIGYLDLNDAFLRSLKNAKEKEETMYVASVVNTFIFNYNLSGLVLTVEGKPVETEHHSYEEPMTPFVFD